MRLLLLGLLALTLLVADTSLSATTDGEQILYERALLPGELLDDRLIPPSCVTLRGDSTWFGQYEVIGDEYYAIPFDNKTEGSWTFDRGTGPFDPPAPLIENGEGWSARDMTVDQETFFRVIDETLDLGPGVSSPIITGERSLWVGADQPKADSLCWECGAGYGNSWTQRCSSPPLSYNGTSDVILSFEYWSFTEACYDGTRIYLMRANDTELFLNQYPAGHCSNNTAYTGGTFTDSIGHYTNPERYTRVITATEIGDAQEIRIVFEFCSDGAWSDEDCDFESIWGPFGADDISIVGGGIDVAYDFETGLQGWEPGVGKGIGLFIDVADVGSYTILDPCACKLEDNILEMHEGIGDEGEHPPDQIVRVLSPICDLGGPNLKTIFMEFEMYAELPQAYGIMHRPGWIYYPYRCPATGVDTWSPRVGQGGWNYVGDQPRCGTWRYGGTSISSPGTPVPPDAEKVIAMIEVGDFCDEISVLCPGITNFTPIYDNITVCVIEGFADAPMISFDTGNVLQDVGSYPSMLFDPRAPGPANTERDINGITPPGTAPDICADTLVIVGPPPGGDPNTRWEARMWWRVAKRAPLQADHEYGMESRYKTWKDRVSDGRMIDRPYAPEFTFGWMDSVETGYYPPPSRNMFRSTFREDDDDFVGENLEENEMIWDDVLYPGSRIEYFITSNYVNSPNDLFYLPDTSGGYFREFEILPGLRTANVPDCGGVGFHHCVYQPATLYIDAYNRGAQPYIENALRTVLNGLDPCLKQTFCEIPRNRNWDRYDIGASSDWNAPFVRGSVAGSNNGMTLSQILGYRTILLNTGNAAGNAMFDEDYLLFDQWLTTSQCGANTHRQVFIMNGDRVGQNLEQPNGIDIEGHALNFLHRRLGATLLCEAFNGSEDEPNCGDDNSSFCLRLLAADGGAFGTDLDIDAWGSYCPNLYGFNVYGEDSGTGNRYYFAEDGLKEMSYAQITNEDLFGHGNYRTILSSPSWHHMTTRDPSGSGMDLCPRDIPSVVEAGIAEIGAALRWGFNVPDNESIPKLTSTETLAECQGTWTWISSADGSASSLPMNRLYQNRPNPFNPNTTIRYQTASAGDVEIAIYDVNGRLVRTLVIGKMDAGHHAVTWDGTNDNGDKAGSGIYWSQMRTGSYVSNKKVVVLK